MMNRAIQCLTVTLGAVLALGEGCGDETSSADPAADGMQVEAQDVAGGPQLALSYEPAKGQTGVAIASAQEAVRNHPDSVEAHLALATVLIRRGRETSQPVFNIYAGDVLASARTISPSDPRVRMMSTMLLLDEHKFEATVAAAEGLIAALPSDPTPRILLGDASLELGNYDVASDAYQSAIDLRPDLRSYNRAAYMRWLYGDLQSAVQIMELALDAGSLRDPESMAWCFADLGAMFLRGGDDKRAIASADRALSLVEGYAPANVVKASALARTGGLPEAVRLLESALAARATAQGYLQLSEFYEAAGQEGEAARARASGEKLAAQDPRPLAEFLARRAESPGHAVALAERELAARKNIWAHDTHALALARAGRIAEARSAMDKATALGTQDAIFVLHRALIESLGGKVDAARAALSEALKLDPRVDPLLVAEVGGALRSA